MDNQLDSVQARLASRLDSIKSPLDPSGYLLSKQESNSFVPQDVQSSALGARFQRQQDQQLGNIAKRYQFGQMARQPAEIAKLQNQANEDLKREYIRQYNEQKRRLEEDTRRAQAASSVLGLVGTVAGMGAGALFGGPVGAAAGAQVGGSLVRAASSFGQ